MRSIFVEIINETIHPVSILSWLVYKLKWGFSRMIDTDFTTTELDSLFFLIAIFRTWIHKLTKHELLIWHSRALKKSIFALNIALFSHWMQLAYVLRILDLSNILVNFFCKSNLSRPICWHIIYFSVACHWECKCAALVNSWTHLYITVQLFTYEFANR